MPGRHQSRRAATVAAPVGRADEISQIGWRTSVMFLWARALLYMVLVGGGWLIVVPGLLLFFEHGAVTPTVRSVPFLICGVMLFSTGASLGLSAGHHLVTYGCGTPFPLDPTRRLVTTGPYRHVRNPQGVAMLLMTAAVVICIKSAILWLMLPLTLIYLEAIVGPVEDRTLRRDFGDEYLAYRSRVNKWIPSTGIGDRTLPAAKQRAQPRSPASLPDRLEL